MKHLKVIIQEGIVQSVLADFDGDYSVEIIDIDPGYEDYDPLTAYADSFYQNSKYHDLRFTTARFE